MRPANKFDSWLNLTDKKVHELSTGTQLTISTLSLLHLSYKTVGRRDGDGCVHRLVPTIQTSSTPLNTHSHSRSKIKSLTERWPTGLDEDVQQIRTRTKSAFCMHCSRKLNTGSIRPHVFILQTVSVMMRSSVSSTNGEWHSFHLAMAVKTPTDWTAFLSNSLSVETMYLLSKARKKGMPFFATLIPVTAELHKRRVWWWSPAQLYPILTQLVETYGHIRAWEREDMVETGKPNAAGWLLPDGHNIHRRYPEVAILIPDTMGRACGGLCASCQRMYDFQASI